MRWEEGSELQHDEIEYKPHLPYTNCFSDVFAPIPTAYVRRSRLFQLACVAVGLRREKKDLGRTYGFSSVLLAKEFFELDGCCHGVRGAQ